MIKHENRIIKINCEFDYGVLKDKRCIKLKNTNGDYLDCQVVDNEPSKYGFRADSLYKDGSI